MSAPWDDDEAGAEALERVLHDAAGPEDAPLAGELDALRSALSTARTTATWSARREARLVAETLARTTREDLSWRGEVRLFADFVCERVAASPLLRLLAASLLVYALGGPVLAWWVLRARKAPEPAYVITIDPTPRGPLAKAPVAPREKIPAEPAFPPPPLDPDGEVRVPADRVENALRSASFALDHARLALAPSPATPQLEMELLAARSRWLAERAWSPLLHDPATLERSGTAALTLLADACLDRLVQEGGRPALLTGALARLDRALADPAPTLGPAVRARAQAVLDRARAYGLWRAPSGFDPLGVPVPLSASDLATLRPLLAAAGLDPAGLTVGPR